MGDLLKLGTDNPYLSQREDGTAHMYATDGHQTQDGHVCSNRHTFTTRSQTTPC